METGELHQKLGVTDMLSGAAQNTSSARPAHDAYNAGGLPPPIDPPKRGGRESGDDGMADLLARVTRLEQGLIASFLFLIVAIGGLYLYVGAQIGGVDSRMNGLTDRVATLEATTARLDERTQAMQKQMDGMDAKLDKLLAK